MNNHPPPVQLRWPFSYQTKAERRHNLICAPTSQISQGVCQSSRSAMKALLASTGIESRGLLARIPVKRNDCRDQPADSSPSTAQRPQKGPPPGERSD
jgi:hypothetical protein